MKNRIVFSTDSKFKLFVLFFFALSMFIVTDAFATDWPNHITILKNYQCKKCGTVVRGESTPSSLGCPSGGSHSWQNLGELGMENYMCGKCGTNIRNKRTPSSLGCPAGSSHRWNHLGKVGDNVYQCRKCGVDIRSERTPSSLGCPSGGSHSWNKLSR